MTDVYVIFSEMEESDAMVDVAADLETAKMIGEAEIGADPNDYSFDMLEGWIDNDMGSVLELWIEDIRIIKMKVVE